MSRLGRPPEDKPPPAKVGGLELRLAASASPARVALAAAFLDAALHAAAPELPDDAVTLVVDNYAMKANVRPQTPEGKKAVDLVEAVLRDPSGTVTISEQPAADVASVIARDGHKLLEFKPTFLAGRGPRKAHLRTMDDVFIASVKAVVHAYHPKSAIRGTTTIYSKVLRVGRTAEGRATRVRLMIEGRPQELLVREDAREAFYDIAKEDRVVPVRVAATWYITENGSHILDVTHSTATGVDAAWRSATGGEIVRELGAAAGDSFDDLEVVEEMLGIGARDVH
jgi:hypothetical protein